MDSIEIKENVLVRFDRGDIVPDKLVELAIEQDWTSAWLSGIGGVRNVVLAYFDLAEKKYLEFEVDGIVELLSLQGNLSLLNDKPIWHLHALVGNRAGNVHGGHLVRLEVAITLECWIRPFPLRIVRAADPFTNLNLLKLK